jgi:hypothetical protein
MKNKGRSKKRPYNRHGYGKTSPNRHPLYNCWSNMIGRCCHASWRRKSRDYKIYGGKGIKVCDRWLYSFPNFLKDMGPTWSHGLTLERKDSSKGYTPKNCIWATPAQQNRNTSKNVWHELNGIRMVERDWCRRLGGDGKLVKQRLERGWSLEKALTTPPLKHYVH